MLSTFGKEVDCEKVSRQHELDGSHVREKSVFPAYFYLYAKKMATRVRDVKGGN